jgi:hypothetical protein
MLGHTERYIHVHLERRRHIRKDGDISGEMEIHLERWRYIWKNGVIAG